MDLHNKMVAKIIQVIETYENRGDGIKEVYRNVYQLWTLNGELIFERDPIKNPIIKEKK